MVAELNQAYSTIPLSSHSNLVVPVPLGALPENEKIWNFLRKWIKIATSPNSSTKKIQNIIWSKATKLWNLADLGNRNITYLMLLR